MPNIALMHGVRRSLEVSTYVLLCCFCVGLSLDEDVPDYDLDSEDEEWLSLQTNEKVYVSLYYAMHLM